MRSILILIALALAGCAHQTRNLAAQLGWNVRVAGDAEFILSSNAGERTVDEALAVAADVSLSRGYRWFLVYSDLDRGTSFERHTDYQGNPGMMVFSIGTTFKIRGLSRSQPSTEGQVFSTKGWVESFQKKKPNKAPEPTPTSGTSAAELPRVPAAVVAHL